MCGSESATFNIFFRPFLIFFLCSEHFVQQPQLKKGSAQNGCLQQYRVLRPLSVFIAPNSFWLKTFTAQSGYCLLHRMPFLILCACAHSLIPRPKTTVTGLGMRLVHTENSAPTMAGRVYSCGSGKALWTPRRVLVNRCRNRALYIYLHTFIFIYHPWGHNRKISCFPS